MRKDLISGVVAVVVFTLIFGVAYPLVVTGVSQVAFGNKADGSLIKGADGKVTGSTLIGQDFSKPVLDSAGQPTMDEDGEPVTEPDPQYFQGRPSATGYSPSATFFSNRAPNSASAMYFYRDGLKAYIAMNGPNNPGLAAKDVPPDAVETSASGVDPHISERNAEIQANRVAAVRGIPVERVKQLARDNTDGRFLGVIGEPGVNYARLNAALDSETR